MFKLQSHAFHLPIVNPTAIKMPTLAARLQLQRNNLIMHMDRCFVFIHHSIVRGSSLTLCPVVLLYFNKCGHGFRVLI
jgi:hypothetical protein